jgi:hypothetical protein
MYPFTEKFYCFCVCAFSSHHSSHHDGLAQTDVISRMRVKAESSASINDGSNAQRSVEIDTTGGVKTEPSIGDDVLTAQIGIRSSGKGSPFETIVGGVKAEPPESGRHHRKLQESSMSMDMPSSLDDDIPLDDDDDDDFTQQGLPVWSAWPGCHHWSNYLLVLQPSATHHWKALDE